MTHVILFHDELVTVSPRKRPLLSVASHISQNFQVMTFKSCSFSHSFLSKTFPSLPLPAERHTS